MTHHHGLRAATPHIPVLVISGRKKTRLRIAMAFENCLKTNNFAKKVKQNAECGNENV